MDIVYIRDLEIRTIIGIYDWEREQKQLVSLGLEMGCDIKSCAATDSIENALNYKACLLYTSPSPRDLSTSRMPSSA